MKGLKPTLLALCIAGVTPAAMADIQRLDDSMMGNITGQAGVSIELETKIDIGRFLYFDEGALAIENISIGGAERTDFFGFGGIAGPTGTDRLDNIRIDIDVLADGDAAINIVPTNFAAVDFRITTGAWYLAATDGSNNSTDLIGNFFAEGLMGRGSIHIDTATDVMRFRTAFAIETMEFDVPFLAIGVRGMQITGADYDRSFPSPLDLFAEVDLYIYEGARFSNGWSSLAIEMPSFRADIGIDELIVGQQSIGSIFVDDLAITNTSMRIYGH
ncbi:hypothetical protein FE848_16895 [Marinobacter sp. 1-3A]|uniref:DUF6160 family protein n=1 Tax=Marinobacter sp. 1-3A TaxID=2582920 RepID=UPI0019033F4B|nr:DUF6160 family protein [Marinobacter sp. 1-3A]MBK1874903.1 hypothetical protein [Marinobacter sp. 1-3A]